MISSKSELISVLRQFNPWWRNEPVTSLPCWRRAVFGQLSQWIIHPPAPRAVLLSGARQTGKTTLLLQVIAHLIDHEKIEPSRILYITFDHPLIKLVGLDQLINLWHEIEPGNHPEEYIFIDEIQYAGDWQVWLKHQVDFHTNRRIAVTGSATPLATEGQESGVGRWHVVQLATLSFYEFLQLRQLSPVHLPAISSLQKLLSWRDEDFSRVAADARPLAGFFNEYLLRGGFPQCAVVPDINTAQSLLREDIVDKVLKRDMTSLYGIRRIIEMEQTFLYLCLHDGGLLDMVDLSRNLEVKKPTATNFIKLLEASHLIHRLPPFGYGKEILRCRFKIYLADAAIAPSVMLKGKAMLEDPTAMGKAVETAFFKHVYTRYYRHSIGFSYWRGKHHHEVDIIAQIGDRLVPFEVKYRMNTDWTKLKGMLEFCQARKVALGYIITRELSDFGIMYHQNDPNHKLTILKIPAPMACYWLGQSELDETSHNNED